MRIRFCQTLTRRARVALLGRLLHICDHELTRHSGLGCALNSNENEELPRLSQVFFSFVAKPFVGWACSARGDQAQPRESHQNRCHPRATWILRQKHLHTAPLQQLLCWIRPEPLSIAAFIASMTESLLRHMLVALPARFFVCSLVQPDDFFDASTSLA